MANTTKKAKYFTALTDELISRIDYYTRNANADLRKGNYKTCKFHLENALQEMNRMNEILRIIEYTLCDKPSEVLDAQAYVEWGDLNRRYAEIAEKWAERTKMEI